MATYYSQGSSAWDTLTNWDTNRGGGGTDPASVADMDDDTFVIQAGHAIEFNIDSSGWVNGVNGLTIEGHDSSTPGMLYAKYSGDGAYYLKLKNATSIIGTNNTNKGRLLANSDGVWGNTGALPYGRKFSIVTAGNTATNIIQLVYLDVVLIGTEPTTKCLTMYGTKETVTGSASADTFTKTSHGLANNTAVMFRVTSGSLPAPLREDMCYYVRETATDTFKVAYIYNGTAINLTTNGSGTIEYLTGVGSETATVNVLEDVSGESQWTATNPTVAVTDTHSNTFDQQRGYLTTVTSTTVTLDTALDSDQLPGANIWLTVRNVAVRYGGTASASLLQQTSIVNTTLRLECEFGSTAGTGTTFYAYAIFGGPPNSVVGGVMWGFNYGVGQLGAGSAISGIAVACSNGVFRCNRTTISGTIAGCASSIYSDSVGVILSGAIKGCSYGPQTAHGLIVTETGRIIGGTWGVGNCDGIEIRGAVFGSLNAIYCSGGIVEGGAYIRSQSPTSSTSYDFVFAHPTGSTSRLRAVVRGADVPTPPVLSAYRPSGSSTPTDYRQFVAFEHYGGTAGAHHTFWAYGDTIKNTSEVRSGGAASSIECVPSDACGVFITDSYLPLFEWTEADVAASAQTRRIYMMGSGWNTGDLPENEELWFEVEYYDSGSDFGKTTTRTTTHLGTNGEWTLYSLSFAPGRVGPVRYRAFLAKYYSGAKVYVDNMLYNS